MQDNFKKITDMYTLNSCHFCSYKAFYLQNIFPHNKYTILMNFVSHVFEIRNILQFTIVFISITPTESIT